jgi:hypothetical protein
VCQDVRQQPAPLADFSARAGEDQARRERQEPGGKTLKRVAVWGKCEDFKTGTSHAESGA